MFTEQLSQALSIQGNLLPTNHSNGNDNTITNIDASHFKRLIAIVDQGFSNTGGNVQAIWQGSNTSGGTFTNIAGSSITISGNNAQGTLEIRADQLPSGNRYLQLGIIVNGGPALVSAWALGGEAHNKPASNFDLLNTNGLALAGATRTVT